MTESFREFLSRMGLSQIECSRRFGIPYRTVNHWAAGDRECPPYVVKMMEEILAKTKTLKKSGV